MKFAKMMKLKVETAKQFKIRLNTYVKWKKVEEWNSLLLLNKNIAFCKIRKIHC